MTRDLLESTGHEYSLPVSTREWISEQLARQPHQGVIEFDLSKLEIVGGLL
jgi:hypothetical protein